MTKLLQMNSIRFWPAATRMPKILASAAARLYGVLLPPRCLLCAGPGQTDPLLDLCRVCEEDLPLPGPACRICAQPIAHDGGLCPACLVSPPPFDQVIAAFSYQWPVDRMIHRFKFGGDLAMGRVLACLLAKRILAGACMSGHHTATAIVPVPLHWRRRIRRGFDQGVEIATTVARQTRLPLDVTCCRRRIATRAQSGLRASSRRRNVRGAFVVCPCPPRSVLLIDDVMTTGSTCSELAAQFKTAGCETVIVACLSRA